MKKIGFIGLGVMGRPMVQNLLQNGYTVSVYSRSKEKLSAFLAKTGVQWCESAGECAAGQDIVITMVGYPQDVEAVYFGTDGILQSAAPGAYLIDMTTTDPALSVRIAAAGAKRKLHVLDAPVSGGETGAKAAALSIMVGGDKADFESCLPVLQAMGKNVQYMGKHGSGQQTKMANQIAIAGTLAGVCEALHYAQTAGLDATKTFDCISAGAAGSWQMQHLMPKMIAHDFSPGFFLKHFIKDMHIALQSDDLPVLQTVCRLAEQLESQGHGEDGTQVLIKYYRQKNGDTPASG